MLPSGEYLNTMRASKSKPDRDRFVKHPLEDTRNGHWGDEIEDEDEYEDECDEYGEYNEIATWHPTCIIYKINDMKIEFDATKNVEYNLEKQRIVLASLFYLLPRVCECVSSASVCVEMEHHLSHLKLIVK